MIFKIRKLSISKKLTLIYSSILLSILIAFTIIIFFSIRNIIIKDSQNQLASNAEMINDYVSNMKYMDETSFKNIKLGQGIFFRIFDKDNNLLYSNKPNWSDIGRRGRDKDHGFKGKNFEKDDETLYTNIQVNNKGKTYYIEISKGYEDIGKKTGALQQILIITSILGTLVSFISGLVLSKKLLKPIQNITKTAKEITSKSLDKRIVTTGPEDELKELGDTFNLMIERLEKDFEKQKRFVSDASHELRTPLSVMHGHVNMLNRWGKDDPEVLSKSLSTLKSETDNMNRLIENLMYLAKGDHNVLTMNKEDFLLVTFLKEVVDETLLSHSGFNISYICEGNLTVNADYNALKQVIRILVDNSIKFSSSDGQITIKGEEDDIGVYIIIKDRGVGIPAESIPYIFDRFYRVDESRTKVTGGTGLGLSIAKQIVQSHNGSISAKSEVGKGTEITVYIPN